MLLPRAAVAAVVVAVAGAGEVREACGRVLDAWRAGGCVKRKASKCRFIHVPKTGGSSLAEELKHLGYSVYSGEKCYWDDPGNARNGSNALTFLRAPRAHVLSQYMECAYSHFGRKHTEAFARLAPGFAPFPNGSDGFAAWLDHFADAAWTWDGGGDWDCYNPSNMMARALTCGDGAPAAAVGARRRLGGDEWTRDSLGASRSNVHHVRRRGVGPSPDLALAVATLGRFDMVGLTELYHESLCLLRFRLEGALPDGCDCASAEAAEHAHDDKGVPRHSLDDFADGVLGVVDALTAVDAALYVRGLDRVLRDLADLERCARRTVVCPARWADLARETANVPGARAVVDRWRPTSRARAVKAPRAGDYR